MLEVLRIVYYFSLLLIKQVTNNMSIVFWFGFVFWVFLGGMVFFFFVSYKSAASPAAIPVFVSCICSGCHTVKQLWVIILPSS